MTTRILDASAELDTLAPSACPAVIFAPLRGIQSRAFLRSSQRTQSPHAESAHRSHGHPQPSAGQRARGEQPSGRSRRNAGNRLRGKQASMVAESPVGIVSLSDIRTNGDRACRPRTVAHPFGCHKTYQRGRVNPAGLGRAVPRELDDHTFFSLKVQQLPSGAADRAVVDRVAALTPQRKSNACARCGPPRRHPGVHADSAHPDQA
jgi:hypothetical protein